MMFPSSFEFQENARWVLLLLLLVPLIWWRVYLRRRPAAVRFSSVAPLTRLPSTWRTQAWWLLPALRTAALILLIVAVARPRKGNEQARIRAEGIAIQLLVDRSGSMQALDFTLDGARVNRLTAIQKVARDFVRGSGNLAGRPDDLIGMISFARYADAKCPLTLDHDFLLEALDKTEIVDARKTADEDGTAIGDALALGVEQMRALDEQRRSRGGQKVKSKVIILLTDGDNNAGDIDPHQAAQMAAAFEIKVYTIGVGTRGLAEVPMIDPFSGRTVLRPVQVRIDEEALRRIAAATGGRYFRATDTDSLRDIYAEIDQMEKNETVERRFYQYKELATQPLRLGPIPLPPLLVCVFALLTLEVVLGNTWLRRLP